MKSVLDFGSHAPHTTPAPVRLVVEMADAGGKTDYAFKAEITIRGQTRGVSSSVHAMNREEALPRVYEEVIELLMETLAESIVRPKIFQTSEEHGR